MLAPLLMLASMLVTVIVSYVTTPPLEEQVAPNTWNKYLWTEETKELKGVIWYKNFRVLCLILFILCVLEYLFFL